MLLMAAAVADQGDLTVSQEADGFALLEKMLACMVIIGKRKQA